MSALQSSKTQLTSNKTSEHAPSPFNKTGNHVCVPTESIFEKLLATAPFSRNTECVPIPTESEHSPFLHKAFPAFPASLDKGMACEYLCQQPNVHVPHADRRGRDAHWNDDYGGDKQGGRRGGPYYCQLGRLV